MNVARIARISALCLIVFMTAFAAFAQPQGVPPCGCNLCSNSDPLRACQVEGEPTTCGAFLAVALCPARPPAEVSILSLIAEVPQETAGCTDAPR